MKSIFLESLGIYDLRNFAREIGVARPTTKSKRQLLDEIAAIRGGKLDACDRKRARGRRPKIALGQLEKLLANESVAEIVLRYNKLMEMLRGVVELIGKGNLY